MSENRKENLSSFSKLEKQNEKLRVELQQLKSALETAKKQQKSLNAPSLFEFKEDKEALSVNSKISQLKQKIAAMKKELEGNLNMNKIADIENHSNFLSQKIKDLESEYLSLKKIEAEQKKAIDQAQNTKPYTEKVLKLKEDIRSAKEQYRELVGKQKEDEKVQKAQHEKCVDLEEKCRKMFEQIKKKKAEDEDSKKRGKDDEFVEATEENIKKIEEKIREKEKARVEEEARMKNKIKELEVKAREDKHQLETMKIRLKEKDQECRITLLKIKELKKVVRHGQLKQITKDSNFREYYETNPARENRQNSEKIEKVYEEPSNFGKKVKKIEKNEEEFDKNTENYFLPDLKVDKASPMQTTKQTVLTYLENKRILSPDTSSNAKIINFEGPQVIKNPDQSALSNLEKLLDFSPGPAKPLLKDSNLDSNQKVDPLPAKKVDLTKPKFDF